MLFGRLQVPRQRFLRTPLVTLRVGEARLDLVPESDEPSFSMRLEPEQLGTEEEVTVELELDQVFVPRELGLDEDDRELGLRILDLRLLPRTGPA